MSNNKKDIKETIAKLETLINTYEQLGQNKAAQMAKKVLDRFKKDARKG